MTRKISAMQRAIHAAEAWSAAELEGQVPLKAGRPAKDSLLIKSPRDFFADLFDANSRYVAQAHALAKNDPVAFASVKAGTTTIKDAYDAFTRRRGR